MADSRLTGAVGGAGQGASIGAQFGGYGAAVGGVIGAVGGFLGGGGEDEAKELAKDEARLMRRTARENRRRRMQELRLQTGMMTAQTAASNVAGGSMDRYRSAVEAEYRSQIDWDFGTDLKNARLVEKGGQAAANQIQTAGIGQAIDGLTAIGAAYAGGALKKPNYVYKGSNRNLGAFGSTDMPGDAGYIPF